jgi:hypothetical protein
LGSSAIEGFQAALLIEELSARASAWLGVAGFASVDEALNYGMQSTLRSFPAELGDEGTTVASADSDLMGAVGLTLAYATLFSVTDVRNEAVGGAASARVYFDGDPFPEDEVRDRALAMLRVSLVNLDRLHAEPGSLVLVDRVAMPAAQRGSTVSIVSTAYAAIALRTARRALSAQLQLYSNNVPDRAVLSALLDERPLGMGTVTLSQRVQALLLAQGALLMDGLTDGEGRAFAQWDVAQKKTTSQADTLDAHAAAVRGLFALYLATGDVRYRERAVAVYGRMSAVFYDSDARIWSAEPAPVSSVTYTPLRFALLQSALRDVYELWAVRPGNEALALELEGRIGRLDKLVLNGWDDRNYDRRVQFPAECVQVRDGRAYGGLQMAERALTGELGAVSEAPIPFGRQKTVDRELDCVPEVDDAHLPAALARSITFDIARSP